MQGSPCRARVTFLQARRVPLLLLGHLVSRFTRIPFGFVIFNVLALVINISPGLANPLDAFAVLYLAQIIHINSKNLCRFCRAYYILIYHGFSQPSVACGLLFLMRGTTPISDAVISICSFVMPFLSV